MTDMTDQQTEALRRAFEKVAGENGEIDCEELRDILNVAFTRGKSFRQFLKVLSPCT
ncbi:unnamed protein product [Echinostoma caproni]|uniref:EF-hand domain-containing protein n=1 Tax=Echinostoma caproni TaxID=27848 RepID=A0A183BCU2_9TREM|nr:unnamed protein product [Echinostoma caproni]